MWAKSNLGNSMALPSILSDFYQLSNKFIRLDKINYTMKSSKVQMSKIALI